MIILWQATDEAAAMDVEVERPQRCMRYGWMGVVYEATAWLVWPTRRNVAHCVRLGEELVRCFQDVDEQSEGLER